MNKKEKNFLDILVRYGLLIVIALPNLYFFYLIFTPLTVYPTYFILNLLFGATLKGVTIQVTGRCSIELIKACIAGSAYYLILMLNLATPKIKLEKRLEMLFIGFLAFLVLNIIRILILTSLLVTNPFFFGLTHQLFWYLVSVVFVVAIWFIEVRKFKVEQIPFYSDLKFIYKNSNLK